MFLNGRTFLFLHKEYTDRNVELSRNGSKEYRDTYRIPETFRTDLVESTSSRQVIQRGEVGEGLLLREYHYSLHVFVPTVSVFVKGSEKRTV